MKRFKHAFKTEWLIKDNDNVDVNKGKCWKFNKNVSEEEKRKFRGETFKKNVETLTETYQ